jgi:hypothetical protein
MSYVFFWVVLRHFKLQAPGNNPEENIRQNVQSYLLRGFNRTTDIGELIEYIDV